jgi:hypothetical protein
VAIIRSSRFLPAVVSVILFFPCLSLAGQTNTLESLKATYDKESQSLTTAHEQSNEDALKQYGKAVEDLLATLKQKGDLDGYLVVEAERKRFRAEGTAPTTPAPVLQALAEAYEKAASDAGSDLARQTVGLKRNYVAALDGQIKELVKAGKIPDAGAVKTERDRVAFELADLESHLPQEPAAVQEKRPVKPPAASAQAGGVSTYTKPLWMVMVQRWQDLLMPPVKKGDKVVVQCAPRSQVTTKGPYVRMMFKIRIGEPGKEYWFDSDGKYVQPSQVRTWNGWRTIQTLLPCLEVAAEQEGRLSIWANSRANLTLDVKVQRQ